MGHEGTEPWLQVSKSLGQSSASSQAHPAGGPRARLPPTWPARPPRLRPRPAPGSRPRSHRCGPVLQPSRAESAGEVRAAGTSRRLIVLSPAAPTREESPWPLWGALARQCHCLLLPASAPAGDPNFGPPIAPGRKFLEPLPGGRRHLSGARPDAGLVQVSVSGHLAGTRVPPPSARILILETASFKLRSGQS